MVISRLNKFLGDLRRVLGPPEGDGELLLRFVLRRDEAAFEALVRRYGPMVLGVCRRVLRHDQDAEDAFQATFLLLARKARAVRKCEALASWLHAVACRTARRARVTTARRRTRERQMEVLPEVAVPPAEAQDWRPLLDHELNRLPEKYRSPLVLCDLRGQPRREAALQLGLTDGTLSRRLAAGRRLLAQRLSQRGVTVSGGALAMALTGEASAALPIGWASITARGATIVAAGQVTAVAAPAVFLMNQVLRSMLMTKIKIGVALVLVLVCGGGLAFQATGQAPQAEARPVSDMELLRREVELLRLRLERVQQQVQTQQAELQALRDVSNAARATGLKPNTAAANQLADTLDKVIVGRLLDPKKPAPTSAHDPFASTGHRPSADLAEKLAPLIKDAVRAAIDQELAKVRGEKGKSPTPLQAERNKGRSELPGRDAVRDQASRANAQLEAGLQAQVEAALQAQVEAALQMLRKSKEVPDQLRAADDLERTLRDIRRHLELKNKERPK